jgi:macrodomain Ter protein organizer (MatP/YcbG family)
MEIRVEISFEYLLENSWSGALDNLKMIDKYDLGEEFMSYLEEEFYDSEPTDTEVNDFIWFMEHPTVEEWITEHISIDDIDDLDELEEYAKDLCFTEAEATITDFKCADKEELLWQYIQNNYAGYSLLEVMQELDGFESAEDFEAEEE